MSFPGEPQEDARLSDVLVPLSVFFLLGCSVSLVTFRLWNHYYHLALGVHFDPLLVPGLAVTLVSAAGVTYLYLCSQGKEDLGESLGAIMKKPAVVGGILSLAAMIPIVENYVHPSH